MDMTALTYGNGMEEENGETGNIRIYFGGDGSPAAFGESAILLHRYFPELPLREIPSSGGHVSRTVRGFALEAVLERFKGHRMLVDDYHIQIMNIQ